MVYLKRLETGMFTWPVSQSGETVQVLGKYSVRALAPR